MLDLRGLLTSQGIDLEKELFHKVRRLFGVDT